jgi:hypothetical protein
MERTILLHCRLISEVLAQRLQWEHFPLQQLQPVSPPSFFNALKTRFISR